MNRYQVFDAARIVLLVLLGGLFFWLRVPRPLSRRLRILLLGVLVGALWSYPNFGFFHIAWGPIHYWDVYHYFMGAKYLPEVGYSGLYEATYVAGRELGNFGAIRQVRDLTDYTPREAGSVDARAVRARFSNERWLAFKRDLLFFGPRIAPHWVQFFLDHGYNDPPPRALILHLLVRRLPANRFTLTLLTSLDYLAVVVAFWCVWRAFGDIPAALALAFFSLSFFARFDFIGGSILRWDWIAALLIGAAAFARGRGGTAGVFFGYAALARIFPVLFFVPLGVKWLQARLGKSRDETLERCLRSAVGLVLVVASGLAVSGGGRSLLLEFFSKIHRHSEALFTNSVGLGSLLVFSAAPWSLFPEGAAFLARVVTAASALYLLLALRPILRARPLESVMYAVPLIFCALSPTGYYYSFLVLLVLLPWQGGATESIRLIEMALLTFMMAASYAVELGSGALFDLQYRASILLGLFLLSWLALEYLRLGSRGTRLVSVTSRSDPACAEPVEAARPRE